jgi:Protein of unknown function (DUF3485)
MDHALVKKPALTPVSPIDGLPVSAARQPASKLLASPWLWMGVACLLLGASGGIRFWRARQFQTLAAESANCPFPLSEFPKTLGTWHMVDTSEAQLDPEIARIAGSSDHFIRNYMDEKSGEIVNVLVLYGPAGSVFAHTPDVCYPAAGYLPVDVPTNHEFYITGLTTPVQFRSAFFTKQVGGISQSQEVCYTFLHNGQWLPEVESRWKLFRYHPGMFKVQLQHPASALSKATENNPNESLLREIVQEIERRTSRSKPATTASTKDLASQVG